MLSMSILQVKRVVDRCIIVGSRHPIAIVPASRRKSIEISSLQTSGAMPNDVAGIADPRGQVLFSTPFTDYLPNLPP